MPNHPTSDIILAPPAVETLLAGAIESAWPAEIINNSAVVVSARQRINLRQKLASLFTLVRNPELDISTIWEQGVVARTEITAIYNLLIDFLELDEYNKRLVLYFPFELIPPASFVDPTMTRFKAAYLRCWRALLNQTDVRANFVDGNILEPELAPEGQPLVRKAAHLIPILIQKGLVTIDEVLQLKQTADPLLFADIEDAVADIKPNVLKPATVSVVPSTRWLLRLVGELETDLQKTEMRFELDQSRGYPPARVVWERRNRRELIAEKYAERASAYLCEHLDASKNVFALLMTRQPFFTQIVLIRALSLFGEKLVFKNSLEAKTLWEQFRNVHPKALAIPELKDEIIGMLSRWVALGITTTTDVCTMGLSLPELAADFITSSPLAQEVRGYSSVLRLFATDKLCRSLLYPVAIFFGSKFKGYAKSDADLDVAVFIKPAASVKDRKKVRQLVSQAFADESIGGKVVEFWLEENGKHLLIRDLDNPDALIADSTWGHLLFAGVWLGEKSAVKLLHKQLLSNFLRKQDSSVKHNLRLMCLSEMEREVLQYRLLHKGYRRFFPVKGRINYPSSNRLSPESSFWDSGYRRLATQLFLARVFLPELS